MRVYIIAMTVHSTVLYQGNHVGWCHNYLRWRVINSNDIHRERLRHEEDNQLSVPCQSEWMVWNGMVWNGNAYLYCRFGSWLGMMHALTSCQIRKLGVAHAPFSPPSLVSGSDMHHSMCVTHMPWCIPESLTSGFLWSRWRGKHSRHSRRMRNPQLYVSGNSPMVYIAQWTQCQNSTAKLFLPCLRPEGRELHSQRLAVITPFKVCLGIRLRWKWVKFQKHEVHTDGDQQRCKGFSDCSGIAKIHKLILYIYSSLI